MERKNWKLWIVVVTVAVLVIMLAGGAASAENHGETTGFGMTGSTEEFTLDVDTEKAASDFVDNLMGTRRLRMSQGLGSQLTGANRNLYDKLRTDISRVANGDEESTIFTYSYNEIYPQLSFTAQDLGVGELFSGLRPDIDYDTWG